MPNLELVVGDGRYIRVPISAKLNGVAVDPTADLVEMAFMLGRISPSAATWQTASWETDPTTIPDPTYYARAIPSPALVVATYRIGVRVHDNPELVLEVLENRLIIKPY